MQLRDYQARALASIRSHYQEGTKKVLLHLATGSGKTVIFSELMRLALRKRKRSMMVVRGRELVSQASERLIRNELDHGVYMGDHERYHPSKFIQLASIDTLRSRSLRPPIDILVIDECHLTGSKSYLDFLADYPNAYILGVTATPYTKAPLTHIATKVVYPISHKELIEQGYLVPLRYFGPTTPDLKNVKTIGGEYNAKDLFIAMNQSRLVGDIVENYLKLGEDRPALCFAVNIEHSKSIVDQFIAAGIPAAHCDAETPDEIRKQTLENLRNGNIKIISNVGIFCTGVDIPFLSCLILARPTKSYILHIQQLGRGTRVEKGKKNCLVLDHAGNVMRHGFAEEEKDAALGGYGLRYKEKPPTIFTCEHCFAIIEKFPCFICEKPPSDKTLRKMLIEMKPGLLEEISKDEQFKNVNETQVQTEVFRLNQIRVSMGYKEGWVYHRLKNRFGKNVADKFFRKH